MCSCRGLTNLGLTGRQGDKSCKAEFGTEIQLLVTLEDTSNLFVPLIKRRV